jgi:hypothetical protein
MVIEYRFDTELDCFLIRISGDLTGPEFERFVKGAMALPGIAPDKLRLTDLRGLTSLPPNKEIYRFAHLMNEFDRTFPPKRAGFVAPRDLAFGATRLFASARDVDKENLRSFRTMDEAMRWMEFPETAEDPFGEGEWLAA